MDELLQGEVQPPPDEEAPYTPMASGKTQTKLGWMEGVLLNVLLAIWGVMLFLRLSWVIGQGGLIQAGVAQNRTIQAVLKKIALILLTHYKFEKKEGKLTENHVELVVDYKNNLITV